jgi:hypothetical protein
MTQSLCLCIVAPKNTENLDMDTYTLDLLRILGGAIIVALMAIEVSR